MTSMTGDITVLGMTMGVFHVEDIGVMVPQGVIVTISARDALRSRDLWRAIAQNILFRLSSGPHMMVVDRAQQQQPQPQVESSHIEALEEQNRALKEAFQNQKSYNERLLQAMQEQRALLEALTSKVASTAQHSSVVPKSSVKQPVVETYDVPMYIPSVIKPDKSSTRIGKVEDESEDTLSDAQDKLRRLRNNK